MKRIVCALALASIASLVAASASASDGPSFRTPDVIHQEKSLYRNILVVQGEGYRCMTFGRRHSRQTCIRPTAPDQLVLSYTKGLLVGAMTAPAPRRVLVLGLGGGVIPTALRKLDANIEIDSVELDPAVLAVAERYFGFRPDPLSRAYVGDGRVFVRRQRRAGVRYDLVMIDAFDKSYIPEHMLTREFLSEVRSVLTPKGVVAANTFADGALGRHETATYQSVFGPTMTLDMSNGNRIILAGRSGFKVPPGDSQGLSRSMLENMGVPLDELLSRIRPQPPENDTRVLTDQYAPANLLLRY